MTLPLKHTGIAAIIAVSFAMQALATDVVVASMPAMAQFFGISPSTAQVTLSVFVAGVALTQLIYGPLSDRYGRRPVLVAGGLLFTIASAACALAPSIELMIVARFVQGVGACAAVVVSRAVVRDIHGADGAARVLSYISSAMAMLILLGPMIGGALQQMFDWRSVYVFLGAGAGVLTAAYAWLLPESNPHIGSKNFRLGKLPGQIRSMVTSRKFLGNTFCVCGTSAAVLSFLSAAPFVMISQLGYSPQRFGILLGLCTAGYVIGTFAGGRLMNRHGAMRLMNIGTIVAALSGVTMLALALAGVTSAPAILLPYFVFLLGNGFVQPAAMAGAISPFPKLAGTASAVMGLFMQASGATAGYLVVRMHDGSAVPMSIAIAVASLAMLASYRLLLRPATRA